MEEVGVGAGRGRNGNRGQIGKSTRTRLNFSRFGKPTAALYYDLTTNPSAEGPRGGEEEKVGKLCRVLPTLKSEQAPPRRSYRI